MSRYAWDGPADPDEEIEYFVPLKTEQEKELGVTYSRNGVINFVESYLAHENPDNKTDRKNARLWELK